MFDSRAEIAAWAIAVIGVVIMGIIVVSGPFHKINKIAAAPVGPTMVVRIVTDPKTIGRYEPATTTVQAGQKIVFVNVSDAPHTVHAYNSAFDSKDISTGGTQWAYIPKTKGTFKYYCDYHQLMKGTLIVK